ncbi:hypothetical protein HanIR_Chr17g0894561 [Helianthus annuus]|nr:hypothetical protein HanIR_Chr17g0894561 [Helianthus annuus]
MLQQKLQKSSHHIQTHPSQRKKQSTRTTIRMDYHSHDWPSERTTTRTTGRPSRLPYARRAVRSDYHPTELLSDSLVLCIILRVAYHYAINLFRLTLLSSAPFNPSIAVSILDPFLLYALLGVTYVTYTKSHRTHYAIL